MIAEDYTHTYVYEVQALPAAGEHRWVLVEPAYAATSQWHHRRLYGMKHGEKEDLSVVHEAGDYPVGTRLIIHSRVTVLDTNTPTTAFGDDT